MSKLSKISALFASVAVLMVPLTFAHAQIVSPYGYTGSYYPTTYPVTNSNQYYNNQTYPTSNQYYNNNYPATNQYSNNGYYPTNSYNGYNSYYPSYYPSPTCTLSITSPTNTYGNATVTGTVSWTSQNASSVYLSTIGSEPAEGSAFVSMYPYETFTLTLYGQGGTSTCQNQYVPVQYQQPYGGYYNSQPQYYQTPTYYQQPQTVVYPTPTYNYQSYNPITSIRNWWNRMGW
jgi:hypothetical protein